MQVTQTLTDAQKLQRIYAGCTFRYNADPYTVYTTRSFGDAKGFYLERNGSDMALVMPRKIGNVLYVQLTYWEVTNTFPIDLSLVEIL